MSCHYRQMRLSNRGLSGFLLLLFVHGFADFTMSVISAGSLSIGLINLHLRNNPEGCLIGNNWIKRRVISDYSLRRYC